MNLLGVLGQCSLLIYVLHDVVCCVSRCCWPRLGVSPEPTRTGSAAAVISCSLRFLVMNKIYRLYYGSFFA